MPRTLDNPDRDFSADPVDKPDREDLRDVLKGSEIADTFDAAVQRRIGEVIGRAAFDPARW
jgi:hypothetical protein